MLESHEDIDEVLDVKTMYVGPRSLLVATRVDFDEGAGDAGEWSGSQTSSTGSSGAGAEVDEVFLDPTPRGGASANRV